MPEGVFLKQYYHLRQADVNAMLEHWTQRQAASKIPFLFRKAIRAIRKKRTREENNSDVDMEPAEEAEEGVQGDDGSQVQGDGSPQGDGEDSGSTEQAHPGQSPGDVDGDPNGVS